MKVENRSVPQNLRSYLLQVYDSRRLPRLTVQANISEMFVFWGPADPKYKLLIVAAPLSVMLSTISIILLAFYWAWPLHWTDSDMSFNSTSILHLIIASRIGEMQLQPLNFAGNGKKSTYDKSEEVICWLREDTEQGREVFEVTGRTDSGIPEAPVRSSRVSRDTAPPLSL